jgi:hypothetical protein
MPDALANTLPQYFAASVYGRFFNNKRYKQIEVYQAGHGFAVGDGIYLASNGSYYKAKADTPTTARLIGTVRNVDVPDKFLYQPVGPYLDNVVMPPGDPGVYVYLSDSMAGGWTTVEPTDPALRIPAWIKVDADTGVYIGGDNTPILASQVGFDNAIAMLPGSPKSAQAAIEALAAGGGGSTVFRAGMSPTGTKDGINTTFGIPDGEAYKPGTLSVFLNGMQLDSSNITQTSGYVTFDIIGDSLPVSTDSFKISYVKN